ncbi:MAG TPA: hypothetical protein VK569_05155, partial [Bacteroidota bacterium]|nr:hypothetical protein [Bacteroidota bacterium]
MTGASPLRPCAALCLSLICLACNHPARYVAPEPEPDPRNFTWTIDTIALPGSTSTLMKSIWGSSTRDIYAVGRADRSGGAMFHYDGVSWRSVPLAASEGGTI